MSIRDFLLKIARSVLNEVMSEITRQITRIQNEVMQEAQNYVREIIGGAWVAPDADRLVNEINTVIIPGLNRVTNATSRTLQGTQSAVDTIVAADTRVSQMVSDLNNTFSKIY